MLQSYEELEYRKLLNVWITLQLVMLSILRVKGDNMYQLTHINKIKLEQEGKLRTEVLVNESILEIVDGFKIDKNQETITRYYPPVTRSRSNNLIEV